MILPESFVQLLALPSKAEQLEELDNLGLLSEAGLSELLDEAEQMARRNPGQARELTLLVEQAAESSGCSSITPRALYLQAQSHAINGEFELARELVERAQKGFASQGMERELLRTYAGLMRILGEQVQFQEALDAGQSMLNGIHRLQTSGDEYDADELDSLAALAQGQTGICLMRLGRYEEALTTFDNASNLY